MHFEQQKMKDSPKIQNDVYSLEPITQNVAEEKRIQLTSLAKKYFNLENKYKAEPFFSRQEYFVISAKWLKRWKVYVGYKQINGAVPPTKYFGCGELPTANQDIVETIKAGSFDFQEPEYHLNIRLKQGLMENKDYQFITQEMYYALKECEHYDMIRIPRKVVKNKEGKKVELYYFKINMLLLFNTYCKYMENEKVSKLIQINFQFSHYEKVRQFQEKILKQIQKEIAKKINNFELEHGLPIRLWLMPIDSSKNLLFNVFKQGCKANATYQYKLYMEGELLDQDKSLNQFDILQNSFIMAQLRQQKHNWLFFNSKVILEGTCSGCREKKLLKYLCSCKFAVYCSSSCKAKDKYIHKSRCPNEAESDQEEEALSLRQNSSRGRCGLRNLGNTCFMNSGLQCISHIKQLVEYFVTNKYVKQINQKNPLGTKGDLSTNYAKMVQNLWFGTDTSYSPSQLKRAIGKYQPMFSGYNQHDSSQLINYLLDGLHQDLNRIKVKPYVQNKDDDSRSQKIIAQQSWDNFLKRNQSIIVDLMYGQYKSIVDCPSCKYKSIQFDPFLVVSLPIINTNKKMIQVIFIQNHVEETKIILTYDSKGQPKIEWAVNQVRIKMELPENTRLFAYMASNSTAQIIKPKTPIQQIRKQFSYRTIYIRELFKYQDPQKDIPVLLSNTICHSIYNNEGYRRNMVPGRFYFFSKDLSYKQVHYKIYSYYKRFYEVASYEKDVINEQLKEQPFRIICISTSHYYPCDYCSKKNCQGCWLQYSEEKFMSKREKDDKIEMEIYWRKNAKEIQEQMQQLCGTQDSDKPNKSKSSKSGTKIENCLDLFQEPEVLQKQNAWYCPKCKDFVEANKQMQIYKAPKILILCLKRFKRKEYHAEKYNIFVDYPVEGLDLSKYVINHQLPTNGFQQKLDGKQSQILYDLIAVSNHMGSTGGGHYTAYCKDITTKEWDQFDDSYVSKVKNPQDVVSQAGYVLFYRRRE